MTAQPHPWQVIAWQVTFVGLVVSGIQFLFSWLRERRESRQQRAKFSYELLDSLFNHPKAGPLLASLDAGFADRTADKKRVSRNRELADTFAKAFGEGYGKEDPALIASRMQFDAVLYYLDRFEHAVRAKLTFEDDLHPPLRYIVRLLRPFRDNVEDYAKYVGYENAVAFLRGFKEWS